MRLREIASALGCELIGDGEIEITGVAGMEQAAPGELTFLANPKYAHKVKHTRAERDPDRRRRWRDLPIASLISGNPYLDFARALELFYQPPRPAPGIHPLASVAAIGADRRGRFHRTLRGGRRARSRSAATPCCIRTS